MNTIVQYREKYYKYGRMIAVFIVGPFLFCKGLKANDNSIILISIMMIFWDSIKLLCK